MAGCTGTVTSTAVKDVTMTSDKLKDGAKQLDQEADSDLLLSIKFSEKAKSLMILLCLPRDDKLSNTGATF